MYICKCVQMVWPWFSAEKEGEGVGLVRRLVGAVMGCFFGCFRIKNSHSHHMSTTEKPWVSRNKHALSSLFFSDDDSQQKEGEYQNPLPEELEVKELKDEAKFLKACGTLLETPVEIRNAPVKWVDISAQKEEKKPLDFKSWLPNESTENLKLERQSDESLTPVKICEERVTGAGDLVDTPTSCKIDGHGSKEDSINSIQSSAIHDFYALTDVPDNDTHCSAISSVSPHVLATSVQSKNKSVRFDCDSDWSTSSSESSSQHSKQSRLAGNYSLSKASPYPTPMKLTDEMQTPGTVFPAYLDTRAGGKTTRIRSQYVYSVLNTDEYPFHLKDLKDENSGNDHLKGSLKANDEAALTSMPTSGTVVKEFSVGKDRKDEASSSSCLKPYSTNNDCYDKRLNSTFGENVCCGNTPGERPILGMVATHWSDDETSHISPKWWDGNGIPNSTNKYKEDQKVSWHATPFEERLEKALSEENLISQRMPVCGTPPVEFNEIDVSDTASSLLRSSAYPNSVTSF